MKNWRTLILAALVAALAGPAAALATGSSSDDGGRTLFIRSAVEHAGDTDARRSAKLANQIREFRTRGRHFETTS
jgi:hypothetical protein